MDTTPGGRTRMMMISKKAKIRIGYGQSIPGDMSAVTLTPLCV